MKIAAFISGGIMGVVGYTTFTLIMQLPKYTMEEAKFMFLILFSSLILEVAIETFIYLKVIKIMNWIPEKLTQKYSTLAAVPAILAVVIMIIYGFLTSSSSEVTGFFIMGTLILSLPLIATAVLTGGAVKKFSLLGDENPPV